MIIAITAQDGLEFRDRDDFKGFKVLVEKKGASTADIAATLKGVATLDPDGKSAWVSQDALKRWQGQAQPAEWIASFDKMVEAVKKFGWVNEADRTVRGHIEIAG
jgi:hypothetical protein